MRVLELVDPSAPAVDITPPGLGAPGTDVAWWRGEPAIIGSDGVLRVGRGAEARVLAPSIATPTAVAVTRDGDLLVTDVDGALWVWRSLEHPGISRFVNRQYIHAVAVHPSGRWAATGGWDDLVVLWDLSDERVPGRVLRGHRDVVATLAWSGDGRVLYAGDRAGDVRAWSDPLAVEPDALRRQVRALAEALAGGRPLPSPEALAAVGAR